MDVMQAIATRRSIRKYRPDPIDEEVLQRLLTAMRLAPSGGNRQPWKFVVVRDEALKRQIADAAASTRSTGEVRRQDWIADAAAIVVPCGLPPAPPAPAAAPSPDPLAHQPRPPAPTLYLNLAIALDHLTLAAAAEGLGTCWVGAVDMARVRELLGIPADVLVPVIMPLGHPADVPDARPRKPLDEIICYDRYG
jgi:nitroreductase